MYFCKQLNCEFRSPDSRELINHCQDEHGQTVSICHETGCEGKVFLDGLGHWLDMHVGDKTCNFCDPPKEMSCKSTLNKHVKTCHALEAGYVQATELGIEPPRLSLEAALEMLAPGQPYRLVKLHDQFGVLHDDEMGRVVGGLEIIYPQNIDNRVPVERPLFFKVSLDLPETQVSCKAISNLGYQVGHIIGANTWTSSNQAFNATFSTANITPMLQNVNSGPWSQFEAHTRKVAGCSKVTYAFSLIHYDPEKPPKVNLSKQVHVGDHFSKLLYFDKGDGKMIAQHLKVKHHREFEEIATKNIFHFRSLMDDLDTFNMNFKMCPFSWNLNIKTHRCKIYPCFAAFLSLQELNWHKDKVHKFMKKCSRCSRLFPSDEALRDHHTICAFKCGYCGKPYLIADNLRIHENLHTGNKPFKCPICPAAYASGQAVRNHVMSLHNEKAYACNECDKLFSRPSLLIKHKWTHYNIFRYHCSQCDYEQHLKFNVDRHIKSQHAGNGTIIESDEWKQLEGRLKLEAEAAAAEADIIHYEDDLPDLDD